MKKKQFLLSEKQLDKIVNECIASLGERIEAIVLFGSRARGDFNEGSDFDICIIGKFSEKEKKVIYLLFPEETDLSFFNELPLPIKIRVFGEGKFLFAKNWDSLYDLHHSVLRDYEDMKIFLNRRIAERFGKCLI